MIAHTVPTSTLAAVTPDYGNGAQGNGRVPSEPASPLVQILWTPLEQDRIDPASAIREGRGGASGSRGVSTNDRAVSVWIPRPAPSSEVTEAAEPA